MRSIVQLPNGHLLLIGFYNPSGINYYGTITEIDETTANIVNQDTYFINTTVPGNPTILESIWSLDVFVRNGRVFVGYVAFEGFGYGN